MIRSCDNEVQSPFTPKAARLRRASSPVVAYRRVGTPLNATMKRPIRERFWGKVDLWFGITDEDCWEWTGFGTKKERPLIFINGKAIRASRLSFELNKHKIPDGLHVLRERDNHMCVNPSHLFLGTNMDNVQDMLSKRRHHYHSKTHCASGHELLGGNLYVNPTSGHRSCKTCRAKAARKYRYGI